MSQLKTASVMDSLRKIAGARALVVRDLMLDTNRAVTAEHETFEIARGLFVKQMR